MNRARNEATNGARSRWTVALVVGLVAASGCATPRPHVELTPAPSSDAPFDERAGYYKAHAADSREADHVFLHEGTRVYWPEDLRPAVDEGSPTAQAIADHLEAREAVEGWAPLRYAITATSSGGGLLLLAGLVGLAAPVAIFAIAPGTSVVGFTREQVLYGSLTAAMGGIGLGAVLLLGGLGAGYVVNEVLLGEDLEKASEAADRAARTYNQSLSDRLGVGVDANGVIFDLRSEPAEPPPPREEEETSPPSSI